MIYPVEALEQLQTTWLHRVDQKSEHLMDMRPPTPPRDSDEPIGSQDEIARPDDSLEVIHEGTGESSDAGEDCEDPVSESSDDQIVPNYEPSGMRPPTPPRPNGALREMLPPTPPITKPVSPRRAASSPV